MSPSSAVFGYGSLIFKPPPFEYTTQNGYIKGFVRRFAQDSHDHRGTPDSPGRVVTLVDEADWAAHAKDEPVENGHIWGKVFRFTEDNAKEAFEYLEHREKDGYSVRVVDVYGLGEGGEEVVVHKDCKVYVAETDNPSFGGGTPMLELAERIASSEGPSGPNKEYLYKLSAAIAELAGEEDSYLTELERLTRGAEQKIVHEAGTK